MLEKKDEIRSHYNADPRKEWDRLKTRHPYERFCEKLDYLTHTEHLMIVSRKE